MKRSIPVPRGARVWVLSHVYDKRSDVVAELFSGTQREVIDKIVKEFELPLDKRTSYAELMEYLDNEWLNVDLKRVTVK